MWLLLIASHQQLPLRKRLCCPCQCTLPGLSEGTHRGTGLCLPATPWCLLIRSINFILRNRESRWAPTVCPAAPGGVGALIHAWGTSCGWKEPQTGGAGRWDLPCPPAIKAIKLRRRRGGSCSAVQKYQTSLIQPLPAWKYQGDVWPAPHLKS